MDQEKTNYGAYGLRLARLEGSRELLVQAPADWPSLEVDAKVGDAKASWTDCVSNDRAELVLLTGGRVRMRSRSAACGLHRAAAAERPGAHPSVPGGSRPQSPGVGLDAKAFMQARS